MDLTATADSMRGLLLATATTAPLYSRLSVGLADEPEVLAILAGAPPTHRLPVNLLAAVHYLLLADPSHPLARWYPNLSDEPRTDDPVEAFVAFCAEHRTQLDELVATRLPQTNEIGRSALLLVGLASLGQPGPLAHLDVGASAGLNLLLEHYGYDFSGHRLGSDRLVLKCEVSGEPPASLPAAIPSFSAHLGLDRTPVDLSDPAQVRWLEACVWPDQTDRFQRLVTALAMAQERGVQVDRGDAVADLPAALDALGESGHPVVTTSWVLSYLDDTDRAGFQQVLAERGAGTDLSWVFAEAPSHTAGLPHPAGLERSELTVLGVVTWRRGVRTVRHLATCHPHGYTLRWL